MKISCIKKFLQEAAILAEKISGRNPSLPVLNSVLISSEDKNMVFLSTNLEMAVEISIPVSKSEKNGRVAVPAKILSGFVSSLPDGNVKLESVNDNLLVTTDTSSTTINGYPVKDFPLLPKIKENKTVSVSVKDFLSALKSVYYSCSLSEIKPELNSVFVYSNKNTPLTFAATDTYRLAEKSIPYTFSEFFSFLIPYKAVVEIIRVFENKTGDMKIIIDDNNLLLRCENITFTTRLNEGSFPDYKKIIPKDFCNVLTVEKKKFIDSLRTASVFSGKLNEIKFRIYKGEKFLELQTRNSELGEHTVSIPCETEGDELSIIFNYKYLFDCLSFVDTEKILLKFSGEGRPLLVAGLNNTSFRYLIMPMKDI